MNLIVILTAIVMLVGVGPAAAQNSGGSKDGKDRGGLGGVLDTLGGILGAGGGKLHGAVVTAHDTTLVLRTDDQRTVRVDTGSIDPQVRQQLTPGQTVTVTARGSGDVLAASDVQVEQGKSSAQSFQRVTGTVQERSEGRVLFRTRDGLTLPVDTSQIRGLPYLAPNTPATLIYQQGSKQEIQAVWIEPGDAGASASPATEPAASTPAPGAASPAGQTLQGMVESVSLSDLIVQTSDGKHVTVEVSHVDRNALASVRPGDVVTITGTAGTDASRFTATSLTRAQ
jgi:translation initiation factor IF-1